MLVIGYVSHTRFQIAVKPKCLHCERRYPNSTRGLCRVCSDTPGVRSMYPCKSRKAHYQGGEPPDFNGGYELPDTPTSAPVGSAAKMAVMSRRVLAGVSLFHPDDNPEVGDLCEHSLTHPARPTAAHLSKRRKLSSRTRTGSDRSCTTRSAGRTTG